MFIEKIESQLCALQGSVREDYTESIRILKEYEKSSTEVSGRSEDKKIIEILNKIVQIVLFFKNTSDIFVS